MLHPSCFNCAQPGVSIATDAWTSQKYAMQGLVTKNNPGLAFRTDELKSFEHNGIFVIQSKKPLKLGDGKIYLYEVESLEPWMGAKNGDIGYFTMAANQVDTEILSKTVFNIQDLIKSGKVKFEIIP
jgi:hypothetical protein